MFIAYFAMLFSFCYSFLLLNENIATQKDNFSNLSFGVDMFYVYSTSIRVAELQKLLAMKVIDLRKSDADTYR